MKVLVNLLKFIFIMILTVAIIGLGLFAIAFSTVLNKDYVVQKLEETDFYSGTYKLVESNFENYIYQSGLDEEVLKEICSQDKVKKDINIMLNNIYSGTNQSIDTTEISEKLNANIDKSGIKNKQNESAINEFVKHICQEYTDTLVHSKYETEINKMYNKINTLLNKVYNTLLIVFFIDLILIIIINCIFPILRDSVIELVNNIPGYYETIVNKYKELPEDSVLKNDIIKEKVTEFSNIDIKQFLSINNEKILEYIKSIIDIFSGIFDVFVSIIVSVYILLQRTTIINALRRFVRAIFKKETYETIDKYFTKANQVFFTFISSQLLDAVIVGILTTIAMMILKVKYGKFGIF